MQLLLCGVYGRLLNLQRGLYCMIGWTDPLFRLLCKTLSRSSGQLPSLGFPGSALHNVAPEEQETSHSHRDQRRTKGNLPPPGCSAAAGQDELRMKRCRRRIPRRPLAKPFFGLKQGSTAKQKTAVLAPALPLFGASQQTSVHLHPGQVCVKGCRQCSKLRIEVILVAKIDSLKFAQAFRDVIVWNDSIKDGNHALIVRQGMINLSSAVDRSHRIRADHEDEILRRLDVGEDFLLPLRGQRDV